MFFYGSDNLKSLISNHKDLLNNETCYLIVANSIVFYRGIDSIESLLNDIENSNINNEQLI